MVTANSGHCLWTLEKKIVVLINVYLRSVLSLNKEHALFSRVFQASEGKREASEEDTRHARRGKARNISNVTTWIGLTNN